MSSEALSLDSGLDLPLLHRGKVRDVYEVDAHTLLMVASDRISAFDVILPQPIPHKGEVLTLVTAWWLEQLDDRIAHHLIAVDPDAIIARHPELATTRDTWARRAMLVTRTRPVLVECVVRGYITGSAWKEYQSSGSLANEPLPEGLRESQRLDPPIFSPATKAEQGEHDENITFGQAQELLGTELANRLRDLSLDIYGYGCGVAETCGIILADTKFEFGFDAAGELLLIDEVLTPDSSRFWPQESYAVGRGQPSLDKQPVREWLDELQDWDKSPPAPELPDTVVTSARDRYEDVFHRLTGIELADYQPPLFGTDR
ncbi:MAG: phosphoribosylaminoimidazolesuccinocarboxamide synthase [Gemmatimonadetes bacterium]|nr:phosphoribosylaminoimidazolesuccinocarboxamide synthase [Gemmatimonadota bacterium]